MTHRQRYAVTTSRDSVVDLLALDPLNPRSILFQLTELKEQADLLAEGSRNGQMSDLSRHVLAVQTRTALHSPDSLTPDALRALCNDILKLSDILSDAYLR